MAVSKVVCIEITDLVTRVCEMSYNKKKPVVYKSIIFDNPEYSIDDGFIADRNAYEAELRSQLSAAKIKCKDVVFVLTGSKVVSREITIPEMKPELIGELIENDRGEYFPMDTTNHIFAHQVVERLKDEKQLRVMIFAAPDVLIKNYLSVANDMDFHIVAIDYAGNTIFQYLRSSRSEMDMYIQINEKNAMFTILDDGKLALQRNMNFGSATLTSALAFTGYFGKDIDSDAALVKLMQEEMLYHSFAEMESADPEDSAQQKLHTTKEYLTETVRPFIANIMRVLEYYNSKNRDIKVAKLYIGGIGARAQGLRELIESEFNELEIEVVDKLPNVSFSKKNTTGEDRSTEFTACIGAQTLTINFYRASEKKKIENTLVFSIFAVILVAVAAVFIVLNGKMEYDEANAKHNKLVNQLAQLKDRGIEDLEAEYNQSRYFVGEVEDMDAATFSYNEYWNDIMSYLETESVSDVIVTSISASETGVTLNMVVSSKEEAAKTLLQYKKIPYFANVTINGIAESIDEETGLTNITFTLLCEYPVIANDEEVAE